MISCKLVRFFSVFATLFLSLTGTAWLYGQDGRDVSAAKDFGVRQPKVFIGGHLGYNMPAAASDLYDMVTDELTLDKSDFRSLSGGLDLGIPLASHFAMVVSFDYARATATSESRDFVEENGDAIEQTTRLSQTPVTVSLRYYPRSTGETIGSYAWIPRRINPYIAAGGGFMHYEFSQSGRFVERDTLDIFSADLRSSGYTATGHVAGGMEISLTPLIFVDGEARYSWANTDLGRDFTGFDPIDLNGFKILGGVYFRF